MQKLNRYLLETDEQRVNTTYPPPRNDTDRERVGKFKLLYCDTCGWNIDPTTPHWIPEGGHDGGTYHIQCYTPGLPSPEGRSRKAWQCFCGHECRCMDHVNGKGHYGVGCNDCDSNHRGDDCNYEYSPTGIVPHECALCGWGIQPIEAPILNKHKTNFDYPHGWMHECCYTERYEELKKLNEEYTPLTITLPEGKLDQKDLDKDGNYKYSDGNKQQWKKSVEEQCLIVEELRIWQSFGVKRLPE